MSWARGGATGSGVAAVLLVVVLAALAVVMVASANHTDGSFAQEANRACVGHHGVRYMNSNSGDVVCVDGTARSL